MIHRCIAHTAPATYFKPQGVPMHHLETVELAPDELEALRLADLEGLYQEEAAERMGISRQTFGQIIARARKKTAEALTQGKALRIEPLPGGIPPATPHGSGHRCRCRGRHRT